MAGERHRGREDIAKTGHVARSQPTESSRGGRGDRVENSEQRIGVAFPVAFDQVRVVEIVPGIQAHSLREASAHVNFLLRVEQRYLDAFHFGAVCLDDLKCHLHGPVVILLAPIARQLRVEQIGRAMKVRSEEHTSELQSHSDLVCRLLLEKKKTNKKDNHKQYNT